jgi:flotillin
MKSVPPLHKLFDQAGLALPEYLAKKKESPAETEEVAEE